PFALRGLPEELHVLGIAARPAAFNVLDPKRIELFGDAEFVHGREIDAFALRTVAQGRVVDFDLGFHKHTAKAEGNYYGNGRGKERVNWSVSPSSRKFFMRRTPEAFLLDYETSIK